MPITYAVMLKLAAFRSSRFVGPSEDHGPSQKPTLAIINSRGRFRIRQPFCLAAGNRPFPGIYRRHRDRL